MNTRGPLMSFRTSRRCLPQKEQWNSSIQLQFLHVSGPRQ
jgi:hypothetical protein